MPVGLQPPAITDSAANEVIGLSHRALTRRLSSYFWWNTVQLPTPIGPGRWQFNDQRGTPPSWWLLLSVPGLLAHWVAWVVRGFTGVPSLELVFLVATGLCAVAPVTAWLRRAQTRVPVILDTLERCVDVLDQSGSLLRWDDARITACSIVAPSRSISSKHHAVVLSASGYFLILFAAKNPVLRDCYLRTLPDAMQQLPSEQFHTIVVTR